LKRFFSPSFAEAVATARTPDHLASLPDAFRSWHSLSQAQCLEITTLLSPYIISSQGDRQLLANGVEGRFPFLDRDVIAFCNSLPPGFKLAGLDEKHILKRVARGVVPDAILDRKKQPYRAPDAVCFVGPHAPDYVRALIAPEALTQVGVFEPRLVSGLMSKLQRAAEQGDVAVSNADNMALVGILSTQLLHNQLIGRQGETVDGTASFAVDIDLTSSPHPSQGFHGH